jgi:hypothetical protein
MTGNRKRLGEEVGDVVQADLFINIYKCFLSDEHDTKVSLADSVPDPIQAHVGGLGHSLRHRVGSNADSHLVVAEQRGGGWWVGGGPCWPRFYVPSVLRLRDKGTNNRDAGGVAGDGVVGPVIVVGRPEVAQVTGDAACVGAGEEGSVGQGRVAAHTTLGKISNRQDVPPRILTDIGGGPWWKGWEDPAVYASAVVQHEFRRHL